MWSWLKKNGAKLVLLVIRGFVKEHTVVGKLIKAIEEAEYDRKS